MSLTIEVIERGPNGTTTKVEDVVNISRNENGLHLLTEDSQSSKTFDADASIMEGY